MYSRIGYIVTILIVFPNFLSFTPLSLYAAYAYEFKPAAAGYLFNPAVITLPSDYSTTVNLLGIPAAKLSGKISVLGKAVSGVKITPSLLSLPTAVTTNVYGKYSLTFTIGETARLCCIRLALTIQIVGRGGSLG